MSPEQFVPESSMKSRILLQIFALVLLPGAVSSPLPAQDIINGSFEQFGGSGSLGPGTGSFLGWSTIGLTKVELLKSNVGGGFTVPTDGTFHALVSSGDQNTWPVDASSPVDAQTLASFFGLGSLPSNLMGAAVNGSGFKQTFISSASTLSFDYRFLTQENPFTDYDEAFYVLDGSLMLLGSSTSALVNGGITSSPTFPHGLPYQTVSLSLSAGSHTLGFGVYNTGDDAVATGMLVDNVVLTVPEPAASAAIFALAAAGAFIWRFRNARRKLF